MPARATAGPAEGVRSISLYNPWEVLTWLLLVPVVLSLLILAAAWVATRRPGWRDPMYVTAAVLAICYLPRVMLSAS